MVAVLARLQLTLMIRGLRQSPGRTVGLILGGLFGLLLVIGLVATFAAIASNSAPDIQTTAVLLLTSVVVSWIVLPLLVFGVDPTLDPARFALLPLSVRQLRPALLVAGMIGVPGVLTTLLAFGAVLAWTSQSTATVVVSLLVAPILMLTCFLSARALTSWFAAALSSRRFQDFAAVVLGVFVVSIGLGSQLIGNGVSGDPDRAEVMMRRAADLLAWTPLGWAAALPGDVAQENWGVAAVRGLLAVGLVALLWVAWGMALRRALTTVSETGASSVGAAGGLADRLFPATPAGAIAARCMRYWRRDPRYSVSLVSAVVVPLMIGAMSTFGGSGGGTSTGALAMPVIVAAMAGPMLVADLAYDHSALWTHVALGTSGFADRLGRVLSMATVISPILLIAYAAALAMSGRSDLWLALLAALPPLLLGGLGAGAFIGGMHPGQAPPPGTNPFGTGGSGSGFLTMVMFVGGGAATLLVAAPILVPLIIWGSESLLVAGALLLLGLVWGAVTLRVGVTLGGRRLDQNWPEMLRKVSVEKG